MKRVVGPLITYFWLILLWLSVGEGAGLVGLVGQDLVSPGELVVVVHRVRGIAEYLSGWGRGSEPSWAAWVTPSMSGVLDVELAELLERSSTRFGGGDGQQSKIRWGDVPA